MFVPVEGFEDWREEKELPPAFFLFLKGDKGDLKFLHSEISSVPAF